MTSSKPSERLPWIGAIALFLWYVLAGFWSRPTTEQPAFAAKPLPATLGGTGLYLPGTLEVDPRNLPFVPQYPLWSDGATKRRWIRLPEGESIDASDPDAWQFPPGTRLWKE